MPRIKREFPAPTVAEVNKARADFQRIEPRGLFYKTALELISLVRERKTKLSLAESIAVLLQTWNKSYYRFREFDSQHFDDIEKVLANNEASITPFCARCIDSYADYDDEAVGSIFNSFEIVLGPVGAAKSLHLLAPNFFPLWDRAIAKGYGLSLKKKGGNAPLYLEFMLITKKQVAEIGIDTVEKNPLKAIDEFNYCKFTRLLN